MISATGIESLPDPLIRRLAGVRLVGAITGAGVSAESGIPTYRGRGGIYDDPVAGDRTVEALSGSTLLRDPDRTWRAIADLARAAGAAVPNPAHRALAAIERKVERFVLLTQNVDNLHRRAGSRNIIDIHGDVFATVCMSCGGRARMDPDELAGLDRAPRCGECSGIRRPDAVLFGEMLPDDKVERIRREFHQDVPDLVIAAGTSALFPYIMEPVLIAAGRGGLTVEINPETTPLTDAVDFHLRGPAGTLLPLIEQAIGADAIA
jgi:NAD-dependent deacetylase